MDKRFLLLGVIVLLFGAAVRAVELSGSCSSASTQCELSINELEVCNDSLEAHTYTARTSGEVASWVNVLPERFSLESGECKQLRTYTIANCYAEPGTYEAEIVVSGDSTIESVSCVIDIEQGHFVDIDISPERQVATQCEEKSYLVELSNNTIVPNQRTEAVKLRVEGIPEDWFELESRELIVTKGNPEEVELKVQAPCDAPLGTYEFDVVAELFNPDFKSRDSAEYVLSEGQELLIESEASYVACTEKTISRTVEFENNGLKKDVLDLELDAPSWVSISADTIELAPGESQEVELAFNATSEEEKTYDISITARSQLFDFEETKNFEVSLLDCYNVSVERLEGEESLCMEATPVYRFSLSNDGVKDLDVAVEVEGIDAELSDESISLKQGSSKEVTAELKVSDIGREGSISRSDVAIEIVMDSSGSMAQRIEGTKKLDIAKNAIISFVNNITEVELGLRVFGHKEECSESELLVAVSKLDIPEITERIQGFNPVGQTPLVSSLDSAANDFGGTKEKYIILVSDGKESCEGNISSAANSLRSEGIVVYAIGFDIDETGKRQLQEIVEATGGLYYDARNSEELLETFKQITKELNIEPGAAGERTFTLKLSSEYFSFEKDYTVTVNDCHNIAVVVPELNLCKGIPLNDFISLTNIGSKPQSVSVSVEPEWVELETESITIEPAEETFIGIRARPPLETEAEEIEVAVSSPDFTASDAASINYLSSASCYGFDLIIVEPEVDAATCEGKQQTIILENQGQTGFKVQLSVDKPFVYLVDETVELEKGERKEVYFFISPPFDITEADSLITITAQNDFDYGTFGEVKLNLVGSSYGLTPVNVSITDVNLTSITQRELVEIDAVVEFDLMNDSNRTLEIQGIESLDFNAAFELQESKIKRQESSKVRMLLDLPEDFNKAKAVATIRIRTNEGSFVRNIEIQFRQEEKKEGGGGTPIEGSAVSIGAGLLTLVTPRNAIIVLLLLIVIGLIIYSVLKAKEAPPAQANAGETAKETGAAQKKKAPAKSKPQPRAQKKK
ncbi:MAG: VWA domain-containing protein [Candidatus Diapherotrites archaeon]|uniref:VWA domain-containing protein n=1 Tax=Candidatus Iainarchaeum sp. TaxID=3101447 RepID=A0A8T4KV13_9ARCH|nr:VWA domain-containing protein [Candidatus Diapherotrites archaeon]